MIPRLLLAFGLASALMPMGIAIITPATSGHGSITTAQFQNCDPNDPQRCPQITLQMKTQVSTINYSTLS